MQIKHFFDAQHQLPDTEYLVSKGCNNYHGHTYKVEVSFEGETLRGGMVVDFKGIKEVIDRLDHTAIYETGNPMIAALRVIKPSQKVIILEEIASSENIGKYIHQLIVEKYSAWDLKNLNVRVCEGYKGEDRANWTEYGE